MNYDEIKTELSQSALSLKYIHHSFFSPYMMYTLIIANNDFILQPNIYLGNEQEIHLQTGDCWLMGGGIPELDELSDDSEASFTYLTFWPGLVFFLRSNAAKESSFMPLLSKQQGHSLWGQLKDIDGNKLLQSQGWLQGRIQSLLNEICFYQWQSKTFQKDVRDETFLFLHWRLRHVRRQVNAQDISSITPLTYQQINNRLRQYFGDSLHQLTLYNRVATAERILRLREQMKLGEIAKRSGFPSLDSVNQSFKKIRGYRLSQFKKALGDKLELKKLYLGKDKVLAAISFADSTKASVHNSTQTSDNVLLNFINVSESKANVYMCVQGEFQEILLIGIDRLISLQLLAGALLKIIQGKKESYYQVGTEPRSIVIE